MSEITSARAEIQDVLVELRKQAFQPMSDPQGGQAQQAPMDPSQMSQGAPMDPSQMPPPAPPMAPPMPDPAGAPPGVDPSVLVQLLQAVEQISQVLQSVAAQQQSQEQKIHHIATDQARCGGEIALLLKLLKQQPEAPALEATPNAPMTPML